MKLFLSDTWKLAMLVLFCPAQLARRLDELIPLYDKPSFKSTSKENEHSGDSKKEGEDEDDEEDLNPFGRVLRFRTKNMFAALRLGAQFTVIASALSLPLFVCIIILGRPRDLILIVAGLANALGVGMFCASLGLLVPLLVALSYVFAPIASQNAVDAIVKVLSHPVWMGQAAVLGTSILGLTAISVEALWRRDRALLARVVLLAGTFAGVVAIAFIATRNKDFATLTLMLTGLALLAWNSVTKVKAREVEDFGEVIGGAIALLVGLGLFGEQNQPVVGDVPGILAFITVMVVSLHCMILLQRVPIHEGTGSLATSIARIVIAGVTAGLLGSFGSSTIIGIAISRWAPVVMVSWLIGIGLAPARNARVSLRDLMRYLWGEGWFELRNLPAMILGHPPTIRLMAGIVVCGCLGFQNGAWVLTIPVMLLGYYRILPDYVFLSIVSLARAVSVRKAPNLASVQWLRSLPPYGDELVALPLPGHGTILISALQTDLVTVLNMVQDMVKSGSAGLRWTFFHIAEEVEAFIETIPSAEHSHLLINRLRELGTIEGIERIAENDDIPTLLLAPTSDDDDGDNDDNDDNDVPNSDERDLPMGVDIEEVYPSLEDIARSAAAAFNEEMPVKRERDLERCLTELDRVRDTIGTLEIGADIASGWQSVVDRWQSVLREAIDAQVADRLRESILQPFQSGNPIRPELAHLFKGRKQLAKEIARQVLNPGRPTLVLHGPRRCGKSSFLLNLIHLLPNTLIPVYVDLQSQAMTASEGDFCYGLVRAINRDLTRHELEPIPIDRALFRSNPYPALEDWLDELAPRLGSRKLLLCLDEFEKLGAAARRGTITTSLFDELRHLIQHREEVSFVLCGAQILEELGPNWSSYFINTRPIEMLYLEPAEARELLTSPRPDFELQYETTIVDQVLDVTRCQPYLVQLVGEAMVNVANRHRVRTIGPSHLQDAYTNALEAGQVYFSNLSDEITGASLDEVAAGQKILRELAHERDLGALSAASRASLDRMIRYHLVTTDTPHRIEIPLVSQWVRAHTRVPE